jgi:hypothetical protein
LESVDCQCFLIFFWIFEIFSVFFLARIATFRSSPLRSIPGLFNDIMFGRYVLYHFQYIFKHDGFSNVQNKKVLPKKIEVCKVRT